MELLKKMINRTIDKFRAAFQGVYAGVCYDRSILVQVFLAVIALVFFAIMGLDSTEWLFVVSAIFVVLITEFLNSAIEDLCDLLVKRYDLHVKEIKDISAGAVLLAAIYALIVAAIIISRRFL